MMSVVSPTPPVMSAGTYAHGQRRADDASRCGGDAEDAQDEHVLVEYVPGTAEMALDAACAVLATSFATAAACCACCATITGLSMGMASFSPVRVSSQGGRCIL